MKKNFTLFGVALLVGGLGLASEAKNKESMASITKERGILREAPDGRVVGELLRGAEVQVIGEQGEWLRVTATAWVRKTSTKRARPDDAALGRPKVHPVALRDYEVQVLPRDSLRKGKPYGSHIRVYRRLNNATGKAVKGIEYELKFFDNFGDPLFQTIVKDEIMFPPNGSNDPEYFRY